MQATTNPAVQTLLVGGLLNFANAVIALYLWKERRSERFLLFWALCWITGSIRWATSYFALANPVLVPLLSLQSAVLHFFIVLGAQDLLPGKPWKRPLVVLLTALAVLLYTVAGIVFGIPAEAEYARFFTVLLVWAACMLSAYRTERLPGYAFAAATIGVWGTYVGIALAVLGKGIAAHVVVPLFNVPLMFSIIVIAYQRNRRRLEENERTLQKIFATAPTPILITRPPHGEIERANAVAIEVLGLPAGPADGKSLGAHGILSERVAGEELCAELAAGRRVVGRIVEIRRPDGQMRTIAVNADRILLEDGERNIFSFYDLTELRRAETAASENERALRAAEAALQKERDDLAHAQRVSTLGELAASLAHEVGQPLTAILSNAQAAQRFRESDPHHPDIGDALAEIADSARSAGDTIGRLRTLIRKEDPQRLPLALNALVEDVLRLMRSDFLHRDIRVVFHPAPSLPPVSGDPVQLRQVLVNLLLNAEEAITAAAGDLREIQVRTWRADGCVALSVQDTGVGLPASQLQAMFDHFVTSKKHGLGMGLAISRTIVEAHHGRIWASRGDGPGLTLTLELPAAGD